MNISEINEEPPGIFGWVLDKKCFHILWHQMDMTNGECIQLFLSKVIGYSIVLCASLLCISSIIASLKVKLPQIVKILRSGSAEGVSLWSHVLMMMVGASNFTYGIVKSFPVSVWGESFALSVQNTIVCVLICLYCGRNYIQAIVVTLFFLGFTIILLLPNIPFTVHVVINAFHLPMLSVSKLLQIYSNTKNSSIGQLSVLSVFTMNFRSLGRFFTYFVETGDLLKMIEYLTASILNVGLLGQVVYYNWWGRVDEKKTK